MSRIGERIDVGCVTARDLFQEIGESFPIRYLTFDNDAERFGRSIGH